jgi:muconolactone delta-isomerase
MEADEYSRKVQEAAELRAFWRAQQDRTARKEFDLSDPEALRKVMFRQFFVDFVAGLSWNS